MIERKPFLNIEKPNPKPGLFKAKQDNSYLLKYMVSWFSEQTPLLEAFFVAITYHILMLPLIWIIGWALPWPQSPATTKVIEINLENWPTQVQLEKIINTNGLETSEKGKVHNKQQVVR